MPDLRGILSHHGIFSLPVNLAIYKRAFVHKSYVEADEPIGDSACISNERLEFLGDGVLEMITKLYLYRRFPEQDEGFMTEKKIRLVCNEHIGKLAKDMGLSKWLLLSKSAEEKNTRSNLKKLGCLFEAFIGALFMDFEYRENRRGRPSINIFPSEGGKGFSTAQVFVETIFDRYIDWHAIITVDDNYKNILQVKIQRVFKTTPCYVQLDKNSSREYSVGVYICLRGHIHQHDLTNAVKASPTIDLRILKAQSLANSWTLIYLGKAANKIKKKAEQLACKIILDRMV